MGEPSQLKNVLKRRATKSYFGTGSFWEWGDSSTHPCVIQVIPRLLFQNPQEPFNNENKS